MTASDDGSKLVCVASDTNDEPECRKVGLFLGTTTLTKNICGVTLTTLAFASVAPHGMHHGAATGALTMLAAVGLSAFTAQATIVNLRRLHASALGEAWQRAS